MQRSPLFCIERTKFSKRIVIWLVYIVCCLRYEARRFKFEYVTIYLIFCQNFWLNFPFFSFPKIYHSNIYCQKLLNYMKNIRQRKLSWKYSWWWYKSMYSLCVLSISFFSIFQFEIHSTLNIFCTGKNSANRSKRRQPNGDYRHNAKRWQRIHCYIGYCHRSYGVDELHWPQPHFQLSLAFVHTITKRNSYRSQAVSAEIQPTIWLFYFNDIVI